MQKGESPQMIVDPLIRRFPTRVRARQRFCLNDFACQARKGGERRFPHCIQNLCFAVDRKHWDNHTACSQGFNPDQYPQLKGINSKTRPG